MGSVPMDLAFAVDAAQRISLVKFNLMAMAFTLRTLNA
jgi:hypothetical protein